MYDSTKTHDKSMGIKFSILQYIIQQNLVTKNKCTNLKNVLFIFPLLEVEYFNGH